MYKAITRVAPLVAACCFALAPVTESHADVVGLAVSPTFDAGSGLGTAEMNVSAFSIDASAGGSTSTSGLYVDFSSAGDVFGYVAIDGGLGGEVAPNDTAFDDILPFQLTDDSVNNADDPIGIVPASDFGTLFGATDTTNGDNGNNEGAIYSATWTFDISSATGGLGISVDAAAMGDFETTDFSGLIDTDRFNFSYSTDGGANFTPLFTSIADQTDVDYVELSANFPAEQGQIDLTVPGQMEADLPPEYLYTQASGTVIAFKDPMTLDGNFLNNEFQTISAEIGETSATSLLVKFEANTNGGSEGFAFRNLTIEDGFDTGGDLIGDADGDGDVDGDDLIAVQTNFGSVTPPPGDADFDGDVDGDDLIAVQTNFGATAATSVPEPAAALLMAFAAAGLAARRNG